MAEKQFTHKGFGEKLKDQALSIVMAGALGFVTSWIQSQWTVSKLADKVDRLEEKERKASELEAKRADADLQDAREKERLAGALKNLADRQQEMKDDAQKRR
jgi:hypothetical protein